MRLAGTGEVYTFTPEQINKAEGKLSSGDDDVRVIELALEQHRIKQINARAKAAKKPAANSTPKNPSFSGIDDEITAVELAFKKHHQKKSPKVVFGPSVKDPLNGGFASDAFSILTGKKSKIWVHPSGISVLSETEAGTKMIKNAISQDKKTGNVTVRLTGVNEKYTFTPAEIDAAEANEYLNANENEDEAAFLLTGKKTTSIHTWQNKLLDYLSLIKQNAKRYAGAVSFKKEKGEMYTYHSYRVKAVGNDSTTVINPWYSNKDIKIANKEFIDNCDDIAICDQGTVPKKR